MVLKNLARAVVVVDGEDAIDDEAVPRRRLLLGVYEGESICIKQLTTVEIPHRAIKMEATLPRTKLELIEDFRKFFHSLEVNTIIWWANWPMFDKPSLASQRPVLRLSSDTDAETMNVTIKITDQPSNIINTDVIPLWKSDCWSCPSQSSFIVTTSCLIAEDLKPFFFRPQTMANGKAIKGAQKIFSLKPTGALRVKDAIQANIEKCIMENVYQMSDEGFQETGYDDAGYETADEKVGDEEWLQRAD